MAKKVAAPRARPRIKEPEPGTYEPFAAPVAVEEREAPEAPKKRRTKKAKEAAVEVADASKEIVVVPPVAPTVVEAPKATAEPLSVDYAMLQTNFKGTPDAPLKLAKLNAVCGENRSGKTAIRQAIEAALTGHLEGCTSAADWLEFSPDGERAFARFACNGAEAEYSVVRGAGAPKMPNYSGKLYQLGDPSLRKFALPARLLQKFVVGDAKLRQQIFSRFGGLKQLPSAPLTAEQRKVWDEVLGEKDVKAAVEGNEFDVALAAMAARFAAMKNSLGKEVGPLGRELEALELRSAEVRQGAEVLPELRQELVLAKAYEHREREFNERTARERAIRQRSALQHEAQLKTARARELALEQRAEELLAQIAADEAQSTAAGSAVTAAHQAHMAAIAAKEAAIAAIPPDASDRLNFLRRLEEVAELMAVDGIDECPIPGCNGHTNAQTRAKNLKDLSAAARKEHEQALAQLQRATAAEAAAGVTYQEAKRALEELNARRAKQDTERAALREEIAANDRLIAVLDDTVQTDEESRTFTREAHRPSAVIEAEIRELESGAAITAQLNELRRSIDSKRQRQKVCKELETLATSLLDGELTKVKTAVEAAVNRYAIGWKISLDLSTGCEWRIEGRNGKAYSRRTISGAEKVSLLLALALAWTEDAPFRALFLDDEELGPFHSSPKNLAMLLNGIEQAADNNLLDFVMVCGARPNEVPAHWNKIITTEDAEASTKESSNG